MKQALLPAGWRRPKGYANGVIAPRGRTLCVAGMVGWNAEEKFESDDFVDQARQALANIVAVLEAGGAKPQHIVRMTWYVGDKNEYNAAGSRLGPVFRELIGHYDIAMTAVQVAGFVEEGAKLEIEATAVVPD